MTLTDIGLSELESNFFESTAQEDKLLEMTKLFTETGVGDRLMAAAEVIVDESSVRYGDAALQAIQDRNPAIRTLAS